MDAAAADSVRGRAAHMKHEQVSIATMTLVRDAAEDRLVRASLERLAREQRPIVVADGGSPPGFVAFMRVLPGVTVVEPDGRGLVAQAKACISAAASHGSPFLLYTEPDKLSFFEHGLASFIHAAPDDDRVGVIVASRSTASVATFPVVQQFTETTFNRACAESFGVDGDYTYGPFLIRTGLARYIDAVTPDLGWGWRPYLFAVAYRLGYRIEHVTGDRPCPPEQRLDEEGERIHRMRQLAQNINGLLQALTRPGL